MVLLGQQALQGQQALLVLQVQQVLKDLLETQDPLVLLEQQDQLVLTQQYLVQQALQVRKERKVTLVQQVIQALQGP